MATQKIEQFTDLNAWKESHKLALFVYKATKIFPKEEMFGLANQMRRAAVSITSNIAEGFGRRSSKEKLQFYYLSKGSLNEEKNQLLISRDVGYLENDLFTEGMKQANIADQLLQGLIRSAALRTGSYFRNNTSSH
ncbi:MAG: four helix bundle protein [Patescibacteria group bacterium]|nr:four helix bundle protein [Patescibacteria group bacterium]